ncbi:MAG TPA: hypothetical protein VL357_03100 [Rariglobus sp.]|jgi:hypothetical protein|nr:hypothetical protein [Rariglobus sp.]
MDIFTPEYIVAVLFFALFGGLLGRWLGKSKNREIHGFMLGFFIGPIGWILVLLLPEIPKPAPAAKRPLPGVWLNKKMPAYETERERVERLDQEARAAAWEKARLSE